MRNNTTLPPTFFQCVRQLENHIARQQQATTLRYQANPSLAIAKTMVETVRYTSDEDTIEIVTSFLGLFGATGTLPLHYSEQLLQQLKQKQTALFDFCGIFHHRLLQHYYAGWCHQQPLVDYEQACLTTTAGKLTPFLQYQLAASPQQQLSNHRAYFTNPNLSKEKLANILHNHCGWHISINTYLKITEPLPDDALLYWATDANQSRNNCLSNNWILGDHMRMDHAYFRIHIIANDARQHRAIITDKSMLQWLKRLTQHYVGHAYKFFIHIELGKALRPALQLSKQTDVAPLLGQTSYL